MNSRIQMKVQKLIIFEKKNENKYLKDKKIS